MKSKKRQAEERNADLNKNQEMQYKEEFKSADGAQKNALSSKQSN